MLYKNALINDKCVDILVEDGRISEIGSIKGEGIEDEVAKEVAIINLANLLTTESIKSSVEQKGRNFSCIFKYSKSY